MFHFSHHAHHGALPPLRDPMRTMHRHLVQALSVGVLLLAANAVVVVLFH